MRETGRKETKDKRKLTLDKTALGITLEAQSECAELLRNLLGFDDEKTSSKSPCSTMRIGKTSRPIAKTCFISDVCSCRPTKIVPRPAGGCVALKSFHDNTTWSFDATDIAS